jgi:hypothetical protein
MSVHDSKIGISTSNKLKDENVKEIAITISDPIFFTAML